MTFTTFHVSQTGKVLTCTDETGKIIINKYENKVLKIMFDFDGTVSGRLYFSLLNPVTKKYFMIPIIHDEVIIGTEVAAYPGIWDSLLIGVEDGYVVENNNLDYTKCTYVSNSFKRIVVRDNFLDCENIEINMNPAIDEMLDALYIAQDRLENAAIRAEECALATQEDKETMNEIKLTIDDIKTELHTIQSTVKNYLEQTKQNLTSTIENRELVSSMVTYVDSQIAESKESVLSDITSKERETLNNVTAEGERQIISISSTGEQWIQAIIHAATEQIQAIKEMAN